MTLFALLFYIAFLILVGGFVWRIMLYWNAAAPLKIPTTPAPVTTAGVVWRMFTEVAFFNSLFKGNKWTWVGGYAFHVALIVVVIRHLRYFIPVPEIFSTINIFGILAGIVMVLALAFLFVRRLAVDRVRYISSSADYIILALLIAIGASGLMMKFVVRPDIVEITAAMSGAVTFSAIESPSDGLFWVHYLLVLTLMVYFPFSKLMHAGGVFFSPTRYQVDNPREKKHVNPWDENAP